MFQFIKEAPTCFNLLSQCTFETVRVCVCACVQAR